MWLEIFKFELRYRKSQRLTYLFFLFVFALAVVGVEFVFQGVDVGVVKMNAPIIIGKTMGAITGIFMILTSIVMGMPMIRDEQHGIASLIYTQPIPKSDILIGRFLGSLLVLILIFLALPLGMMLGHFMPWKESSDLLPFDVWTYISSFLWISLPSLFFGAALFFVTGMLSRKLLVVYTQGIVLFVLFLLTKAITNEYWQALLDPFSLTTITLYTSDWSTIERSTKHLFLDGVLLHNKLLWMILSIVVLVFGYRRFNFKLIREHAKIRKAKLPQQTINSAKINIPFAEADTSLRSSIIAVSHLSCFYLKTLLKETSFWAIVICALVIIFVNSINLGTVYGVDSYPATYFIIEELQEMSSYFFIIILLFYSAELFHKERDVKMELMSDATAVSSFVILISKLMSLVSIYIILMLVLILAGITFQFVSGYYHLDLSVYLSGFLIEILPFLLSFTILSLMIHALVNKKFVGIVATLMTVIVLLSIQVMRWGNVLTNYGGQSLPAYSEMNGYGHFLHPYLWGKLYWLIVGGLMLVFSSRLMNRGLVSGLRERFKNNKDSSKRLKLLSWFLIGCTFFVGGYLYYQSNVLYHDWSESEKNEFRAAYESTLGNYEYLPQPEITDIQLHIELFPEERSYEMDARYVLYNDTKEAIDEIHLQTLIEDDVFVDDIVFSKEVVVDSQYQRFNYLIYQCKTPLAPGDSIGLNFHQGRRPQGFNLEDVGPVLHNGTFINNSELVSLGYNRKYELKDTSLREIYKLPKNEKRLKLSRKYDVKLARTGSDAKRVNTDITIGTSSDQSAVTSGALIKTWKENGRNYFRYKSVVPIVNFYAILSGIYLEANDQWTSKMNGAHQVVDVSIFHHERHAYNVAKMIEGVKATLDYHEKHFSPYQYNHLRIIEFPRYADFAQSFPGTIPFSESLGFVLDVTDEKEVDMVLFVTAHEVAHQWWGMQIEAANVPGQNLILETLAQYSALMVCEEHFSKEQITKLLEMQKDLYKEAQRKFGDNDVPLIEVENQAYLYYNKGLLVMNDLKNLLGAEILNVALKNFIQDWHGATGKLRIKEDRYATACDLVTSIEAVTPKELHSAVRGLLVD